MDSLTHHQCQQLHSIFTQCKGLDGRRVSLTRAIGAGGVGGSFDRGGYMVFATYNVNGPDGELL
jgi:hypothetical protein